MNGFNASYPEIEPRELVRYLIRETGHSDRTRINPAELLKFLKLDFVSFDFAAELPPDAQQSVGGASPRALISFSDRIVATDESLDEKRTRFSVLHEIGHYVLPNHEHSLYVCDDAGLSFGARLSLEREANEFAADLLFLGDRFSLDANSRTISAASVKELATAYAASFEATARRLAERNFRPCMLVSFKQKASKTRVDVEEVPEWTVRYCVASPAFRAKYFEKITGSVPTDVASEFMESGRDFADSCVRDLDIRSPNQTDVERFRGEFFYDSWNIFCLLTPE